MRKSSKVLAVVFLLVAGGLVFWSTMRDDAEIHRRAHVVVAVRADDGEIAVGRDGPSEVVVLPRVIGDELPLI